MWVPLVVSSIAAVSIYAGMPVARSRRISGSTRIVLSSAALGILLFLFYDLFATANDLIDSALGRGPGSAFGLAVVFVAGISFGGMGLPLLIERLIRQSPQGRGTPAAVLPSIDGRAVPAVLAPIQLSLMTAVAIGVHNFSEGLAVGAAYAGGLLTLSILLSIGVIAHKSAEGYCICGCAADASRDFSTQQLGVLGAIGGGPVVVGALAGSFIGNSLPILAAVYGLAIGAILSVVLQMLGPNLLRARRVLLIGGILIGLVAAFGTDLTLTATGF